jgi:hypothetical protein
MTKEKVVLVALAAALVVAVPIKFGTNTRGNVFKKGTKAPAATVVGVLNKEKTTDRLKKLLVPIDWANPLATQVTHPKKPKKEEQK